MKTFFNEFTELMAYYSLKNHEVIICGDLNFHVNDKTDVEATTFLNILDLFDLQQIIKEPTHRHGD